MVEPSGLISTIATFSTAGFVISSALPTISAVASQIIKEREGELEMVRIMPLRLLSRFLRTAWLSYFYLVSILFLLSGLTAITYDYDTFPATPDTSVLLLIIALLMTIGGYVGLVVRSTIFLPSDVKKILPYLPPITSRRRPRRKSSIPCPVCAAEGKMQTFQSWKEAAGHILTHVKTVETTSNRTRKSRDSTTHSGDES